MRLLELSFFENKKIVAFATIPLLIASLFISYTIGKEVNIISDFNVFWQAGTNFMNHLPLYSRIGGAERYIYPPFAAMCFQLFALLSIHKAAAIFCFCNCLIWVGVIYYTKIILLLTSASIKQINYSLIIAFILSFRYLWYHLSFIQMNELVLLLTLAGVYYFLKKRNSIAIPLLVIAVFIKIIPILILAWVLSKSNYKAYIQTGIYFMLCLLTPFLFRGIHQGINDMQDYYVTFLQPFQEGRVEAKIQNYGLAAALFKIFSYTEDGNKYHYIITILNPETVTLIYKSILLFSFVGFIVLLVYSRFVAKTISLVELGFILMFTHLLSGITWEYYLITLFFIIPMLVLNYMRAKPTHKWFYYVLGLILVFNAVIGGDTVGNDIYYKSCGYSLLTWMLLFLELYFLIIYLVSKSNRLELKH